MTTRITDLSRISAQREAELYARLGELNRRVVEVEAARLALQGQLERSYEERELIEGRERQLNADSERRIEAMKRERDQAWQRVRDLEASLQRASDRQRDIEDEFDQLRGSLERERVELRAQLDRAGAELSHSREQAVQLCNHGSRLFESMSHAQRLAEIGGTRASELEQYLKTVTESFDGGNAGVEVVGRHAHRPPSAARSRATLRSRQLRLAASLPLLLGALASAKAVWDRQDYAAVLPAAEDSQQHRVIQPAAAARVDGVVPVAEQARVDLATLESEAPISLSKPRFDAALKRQQEDLLALGFDLGAARADGVMGALTRQALDDFAQLYLPVTGLPSFSSDAQVLSLVGTLAKRLRHDSVRLNLPSTVLAALQISHLRTGVPFAYLAELAAVESQFNPSVRAVNSTAAGLFQFTEDTWLRVVKTHGSKYGLDAYVQDIHEPPESARRGMYVSNPKRRRQILDLRLNARISTLMAAEFAKDNRRQLASVLQREIDATDLYLAHFLGATEAIAFLSFLQIMPDEKAADLFPEAANANVRVFRSPEGVSRTVSQVYSLFEDKFDTGRFQDWDPDLVVADITD